MNITPNVLRAFAQAFQLVADALDQPQAQPGMVPVINLAPVAALPQTIAVFGANPGLGAETGAVELLRVGGTLTATPAPVAEAPKAKRVSKAKPAPVANDEDEDLPPAKKPVANDDEDAAPVKPSVKPIASDDEDEAPPAPKAKKPVASDDEDEAPAPKAKPAPVAVVDFAKLRAEAAALLVAYVDEHGMSLAAKVLRKHGADKVSKVADVSLQSLVDALKAGEPE